MYLCALLDDYQNVGKNFGSWKLIANSVQVKSFTEHFTNPVSLVRALLDFDIIVVMRERTAFDQNLFNLLPKLKLLVTTGEKNTSIDLIAAKKNGVTVCGTRTASSASTVELTWGLIISLYRNIPSEVNRMKNGGAWQMHMGTNLSGKRLGIIGLGNIGKQIAKIGNAFGMNVTSWSRSLTKDKCVKMGIDFSPSLHHLLRSSDVISIHIPLNDESKDLIGTAEFDNINSNSILINTSRGPIISEKALVHALTHEQIAGVALDVYDQEPLPLNHPYRSFKNIITTPHIGYVTNENYAIYFIDIVENIDAWLNGKYIRALI